MINTGVAACNIAFVARADSCPATKVSAQHLLEAHLTRAREKSEHLAASIVHHLTTA